jgi:Putative adhesin
MLMKVSLKTFLFALAVALAPQVAAQGQGGAGRPAAEDFALERRSEAEPKAVVSLCITSGDVIVRGWDRGEVRARIQDSGALRLLTPNVRPAPRVEVLISEDKEVEPGSGACGSNERVELMVPRGATVEVESRSGHVEVADVGTARVKVLSGDVNVRRVSQSVEVSCLSGDVSVEDSSGPVRVATVSGDVDARNVRRLAPGDDFDARSTSGDVTIEDVAHGQVSGTAVSGQVLYTGSLARGGSYDFRTISGDVTMELPADSSFRLHAKVVVSGEIDTDFPVRTSPMPAPDPRPIPARPGTPTPAPMPAPTPRPDPVVVVMPPQAPGVRHKPGKVKPLKEPKEQPTSVRLDGTVGTGDAVVNLSSFSGSLHLKKR